MSNSSERFEDALAPFLAARVDAARVFCRGTAVSVDGHGCLFVGPSGSGKSQNALRLLSLGAELISDDGVWISAGPTLTRPDTAPDMIEARGLGLLHADCIDAAPLSLIVRLDLAETDRLPPERTVSTYGKGVPTVWAASHPDPTAALWHYLRFSRAK